MIREYWLLLLNDWQVLSVVFFLMLATMGIGAVSSLTGALISTVVDSFSTVTRWVVLAVFCLVGFSIGLVYITPVSKLQLMSLELNGWLDLVLWFRWDWWLSMLWITSEEVSVFWYLEEQRIVLMHFNLVCNICLSLIQDVWYLCWLFCKQSSFAGYTVTITTSEINESLINQWIYLSGLKNLILDVEFMLGFKLGRYWKYTLGYFIPISLVCVFAAHYSDFNFQQFDPTLRGTHINQRSRSNWFDSILIIHQLLVGAL